MAVRQIQKQVSDRFRIEAPSLEASVGRSSIGFSRLAYGAFGHGRSGPADAEEAYSLHLQLRDTESYELHLKGHCVAKGPARDGAIFLSSLENEPVALLESPFDFLRIYLPQAALDELASDVPGAGSTGLRLPEQGLCDHVLRAVVEGLLPLFAPSSQAGQLFLDSIALTVLEHLLLAYSGEPILLHQLKGGLTPWQERRAKEYMDANIGIGLTLADVARQCDLSASHFSKAFRITTGRPPHRWLLERRVELAKDALARSAAPLAEVARQYGFSDASHLSRTFSQFTGEAPAAWRRRNRN
ncbi:MAG: AraC family transcriptional regulator [Bradyrhizobium sp.]|nr:AraC family transcriptional regulator [Bradyrhizobium sp.]